MSIKRIVVTGGAGFIGSHLCEHLVHMGHDVLCVDNFYTGSRDNIEHLIDHPNFEMIEHDICCSLYIDGVDEIYNLASPASPIHYQKNPIQTLKTNVLGSMNVLEIARRCRAKILQASTSEVYGDPLEHPQKESYWGNVNSIGLRSCYDEGKRCAETLFFDYHRTHKIRIKVVRIFNTYGPRMDPEDGRVVSNFLVQALQNKPLTIYGKGTQTRSFCYIDDLIEGLIRVMDSFEVMGPINLGNPQEYTIEELSDIIIQLSQQDKGKEYHPLPTDDPQQRRPDITFAKTALPWAPKVALEEGLTKTMLYFKKKLSRAKADAGIV